MENKGFIFVLMPFKDKYNDVYHYGIKKTVNDCGFYCERVDEQIFEGTILSRIYNQIQKADLIISDMSERNPNVFYETGYAHALQKNVILLTQNENDIPFDLQHYPHIIYKGNIKYLSEELTKKINWLSINRNQVIDTSNYLEIYNEGKKVVENSEVKAFWVEEEERFILDDTEKGSAERERKTKNNAELRISFDLFNNGLSVIEDINEIALVLENTFKPVKFAGGFALDKITKLPNNKVLIKLGRIFNHYPQSWESSELVIGKKREFASIPRGGTIRIFTKTGIQDIPFTLNYQIIRVAAD
jgi:hypothetical protein